jgi:hypothetical protein
MIPLERLAPYGGRIVWGTIGAAAAIGAATGAIIGLRMTRPKESS